MQAFLLRRTTAARAAPVHAAGRISAPTDLLSRAGSLQAALAAEASRCRRRPISAVNPAGGAQRRLSELSEHAYARWQPLKARVIPAGSAAQPVALPERPRRGDGRPPPALAVHRRPDRLLPSDLSRPIGLHTWRSALHAQRGRGGRPRRAARRRGLCAVPPVRPSRPPRPRRRLLLPEQQRGRRSRRTLRAVLDVNAPWRRHAADLLPPRRRR